MRTAPKKDTKILLDYLAGKEIDEQGVRKILKEFTSAYSYYQLIAKFNKIEDPFNEKVVRAYWIGNKFLEKVPLKALKEMISQNFKMPFKAQALPQNSKPQHSFHVYMIGSVTGRLKFTDKLRELCKVSAKKEGKKWFAYHWGERCEKLSQSELENLKKYTFQ